jgi:catechol 2,3-dioxygenase-like lactoylglutathione lyase family enzyme
MPATPIYHFGLLVDDIEAAKQRLGEVLGITFGDTMRFDVGYESDGVTETTEVVVAYSVEGPPFVELNQSRESGLFGRDRGEGLHHIGVWESSLGERLETLAGQGVTPEIVIRGEDGSPIAAYLDDGPVHGVRLELVAHLEGFPGYTPELPGTGV